MTLTIIIVAVVLMTVGLTLVTLFGTGIGDFFDVASETGTQAQIDSQCSRVAQNIDEVICGAYANNDGDVQANADGEFNRSCTEASCGIEFENRIARPENIGDDADEDALSVGTEINIDGDTYDCVDQIHIPNQCPVN